MRQGIVDIAEPVAPPAPKESKSQRLARQKLEREALRNMEIEREQEVERLRIENNNALLSILLLGSQ